MAHPTDQIRRIIAAFDGGYNGDVEGKRIDITIHTGEDDTEQKLTITLTNTGDESNDVETFDITIVQSDSSPAQDE